MYGKRFFVLFFLFSFLLSFLVFDVPVVRASDFAGGSGTVASPYQISNWTHLNNVRSYLDKNFTLINNLNSGTSGYNTYASSSANAGAGWLPIGDDTNKFTGTFDGDNYTISDLFINRSDTSYAGLFGYTYYASICNVGLVNINITGDDDVGGLVGLSYWSSIYNSYATGAVSGSYNIGGLVGFAGYSISIIDSCYATGTVTGDYHVGGLIGYLDESTVQNCYATGTVTGNTDVGGLIGYAFAFTIDTSYATGAVSGIYNIGGLVGYGVMMSSTVDNSYATGTVTGTGEAVGGLIGYLYVGTVQNCYATGTVTGNTDVGGLIGYLDEGIVQNCYSIGEVTGNTDVGGLIGYNDGGTVTNSFWDMQTSNQATSDGGTGKTTSEMKNIDTFDDAGWDISYTTTDINNGYPVLGWQISSTATWVITRNRWSIMEYAMRGYVNTLGVFTWVIIFTAVIGYSYLKNQSVVIAAAMIIILIAAFSNALIGVETWINLLMILSLLAFTGLLVYFLIKQRGGG